MPGTKKTRAAQPAVATVPELQVSGIPVTLDRVGLRALSYEEKPTSEPVVPLTLGDRLDVKSQMEVRIQIYPEGFELFVEMVAVPDPKHLPIEIKAGISAFFTRQKEMGEQQILDFVSGPGIRIIFPYIREVISNTSARGVFGPLWLDPMAIAIVNLQVAKR